MEKITDYSFESSVSFLEDRTDHLIEKIKKCSEELEHCENREKMKALLEEKAQHCVCRLTRTLSDLNLGAYVYPIEFAEDDDRPF